MYNILQIPGIYVPGSNVETLLRIVLAPKQMLGREDVSIHTSCRLVYYVTRGVSHTDISLCICVYAYLTEFTFGQKLVSIPIRASPKLSPSIARKWLCLQIEQPKQIITAQDTDTIWAVQNGGLANPGPNPQSYPSAAGSLRSFDMVSL